jgi:hypothetical protein
MVAIGNAQLRMTIAAEIYSALCNQWRDIFEDKESSNYATQATRSRKRPPYAHQANAELPQKY